MCSLVLTYHFQQRLELSDLFMLNYCFMKEPGYMQWLIGKTALFLSLLYLSGFFLFPVKVIFSTKGEELGVGVNCS